MKHFGQNLELIGTTLDSSCKIFTDMTMLTKWTGVASSMILWSGWEHLEGTCQASENLDIIKNLLIRAFKWGKNLKLDRIKDTLEILDKRETKLLCGGKECRGQKIRY